MDTSARRKLWDMLKNNKMDKVIILTTHFMDEADYLGDRIAIMGEGKLQCCGRPLFLKNRFGIGYNLTIVKKDINLPSDQIIDVIKKFIPSYQIISNVSAEICVQLPLDTVPQFKNLFEAMDENQQSLGFSSYGISVTTLEEVFLKIAHITKGKETESRSVDDLKSQAENKNFQNIDDFDLSSVRMSGTLNIFFTHFTALVLKRFHYFKRDRRGLICEVFLPILIILLGLGLLNIQIPIQDPYLPLTSNIFQKSPINFLINSNLPNGQTVPSSFFNYNGVNSGDLQVQQDSSTTLVSFDNDIYTRRSDVDPPRFFSIYLSTLDNVNQKYQYSAFANTTSQSSSTYSLNLINNKIFQYATNNPNAYIRTTIAPLLLTQSQKTIGGAINGVFGAFAFSIGISFIPASLIVFIVKEREWNVKHQQMVSGVSLAAYWFSNYVVDLLKHILPTVVCCLMILAFNVTGWTDSSTYGAIWLIFILYGFCIGPWSYFVSFFFKDPGNAQLVNFFFNFIVGFIVSIVLWVLRLIDSTRSVAKGLSYFFRFVPTFSFSYGLLNISS